MFYIYTILNLRNYKIYVGQTQNIAHRWAAHKCEARATRLQHPLYKALRKYGIENFGLSVMQVLETSEQASIAEMDWIQFFESCGDMGYNIATGGSVARGWHHSEESIRKISESNKGIKKPHTEEWAQKVSRKLKGKPKNEEWKKKRTGSNHPMAKLTDKIVRHIREEYAFGTVTQTKLSQKYGVSLPTVNRIVNNKAWIQ